MPQKRPSLAGVTALVKVRTSGPVRHQRSTVLLTTSMNVGVDALARLSGSARFTILTAFRSAG